MKLKSQLACSALAMTAGVVGCTIETTRTDPAPLATATPSECPMCTPNTFTITLPKQTPTPTPEPTIEPTPYPTASPEPTIEPTPYPTASPEPTIEPTPWPTYSPTPWPTGSPTPYPSATPYIVARSTSTSSEPTLSTTASSSLEMSETLNFAAALSPEGKACLDGGGSIVAGATTETSTSISTEYSCDCGGAQ